MRSGCRITVLIPALNEELSIGRVLGEIPDWVDEIIVADNGSTDRTIENAKGAGATVVQEPHRGYGSACLRGIASLRDTDVVVFLDGDYSDFPAQMDRLVDPIASGNVDMVIGSRVRGHHQRGALTPQARFGNALACFLLRLFWGVRYTDLGPFRAIRYSTLTALDMQDPDYGWTVEMQIKAALSRVRTLEVPVDYRRRIGVSKVSGTVRGVVGAGYKILSTIFISAARHYLSRRTTHAPRNRLIVFTRYPVPGNTKTRLIPELGDKGAADLQRAMTERMATVARNLTELTVEIRFTGGTEAEMRKWLGDDTRYVDQGDGDLGDRMALAFRTAFRDGSDRVIIVGTDCPDLTGPILRSAFDRLAQHDVVLGPATDGGYYLIGVRREASARALPRILSQIDWGTEHVFGQTLAAVRAQGLSVSTLVPLDDVDHPEDLEVWKRATRDDTAPDEPAHISIIIPTLNEAAGIQDTITCLNGADRVDVCVVDGGSDDGTPERVRKRGVPVLHSTRGRAAQMNRGAARAEGDILLFLHADTRLPTGFEEHVRIAMAQPDVSAGAFTFSTNERSLTMRAIAWVTNQRARRLGMPYGDQALFMRKHRFREIGGYPDIPIMEDFVLMRRLRRQGRIVILPECAVTSARRWNTVGKWRTTLYNQFVIALFLIGIPHDRIERFYDRRRGTHDE